MSFPEDSEPGEALFTAASHLIEVASPKRARSGK
jgi:hypothetical protein